MGHDNGPPDDVIKSYLDSVLPIDDYERPAYLDMTPVELSALGEPMAYTDMGDDPATIKALDDAEDFDELLSRSSVGGGPLTADRVSAKYRMTVDEAQAMIDAGAVESGGILFVSAEARDAFYTAIGGVDPSNPFADAYAAVMHDEVARAEAAATSDDDIPGAFFDALGDAMDDGVEGFPDDDESYANKVNAPLTEAEAREIGRQIKSGDYPRYKRATGHGIGRAVASDITDTDRYTRTTLHKTDRDGITTTVHEARPVRRRSTGGDDPGFIECANIEGQLWSSIAGDHEPEHAADPMFYIWSNKHQLYWGPNRKGYVAWPSQAGQYTAIEASAIINHSMRGIILGQNRAVPDSIMLPVPETIPDGAE